MNNFFAELKPRNVYKVAVAYAVASWLLIEIATQVFPFFEILNWAVRLVVLAIVIGLPIALVIAQNLRKLLLMPAGDTVSIARLKIDPAWDPIRNDPGFQQLLTVKEHVGQ
jgi:hypothetical protein